MKVTEEDRAAVERVVRERLETDCIRSVTLEKGETHRRDECLRVHILVDRDMPYEQFTAFLGLHRRVREVVNDDLKVLFPHILFGDADA